MSWQIQTNSPLFQDIVWSRPQNRQQAGKLLIIGGNSGGFLAPARSYEAAAKAGIGTSRVLLPETLRKKAALPSDIAWFAPSTPSGSFARAALAEWLAESAWSDAVVLAGDFGRNSETAILLEEFLGRYKGPLTITGDTLGEVQAKTLFARPNTLLVPNFSQLQKLGTNLAPKIAFQSGDLMKTIKLLQNQPGKQASVLLAFEKNLIVSHGSQISTTSITNALIEAEMAAVATVYWLQQPSDIYKTITTAAFMLTQEK